MDKKIHKIDWGLAYTRDNEVYINRHLEEWDKKLYDYILSHEFSHDTTNKVTFEDLKRDFDDSLNPLRTLKKWWFCITHPKALVQFSPLWIYKKNGEWVFDIDFNALIIHGGSLVIGILLLLLLIRHFF